MTLVVADLCGLKDGDPQPERGLFDGGRGQNALPALRLVGLGDDRERIPRFV